MSNLLVDHQTAELLVTLLLRLDDKLCRGGLDDSNGIIGGFMQEVVGVLEQYAKLDPDCIRALTQLKGKETCFYWEEPLLILVDTKRIKK